MSGFGRPGLLEWMDGPEVDKAGTSEDERLSPVKFSLGSLRAEGGTHYLPLHPPLHTLAPLPLTRRALTLTLSLRRGDQTRRGAT